MRFSHRATMQSSRTRNWPTGLLGSPIGASRHSFTFQPFPRLIVSEASLWVSTMPNSKARSARMPNRRDAPAGGSSNEPSVAALAASYGYGHRGVRITGVILIVLLILLLTGRV
jgi:hypothetical protein